MVHEKIELNINLFNDSLTTVINNNQMNFDEDLVNDPLFQIYYQSTENNGFEDVNVDTYYNNLPLYGYHHNPIPEKNAPIWIVSKELINTKLKEHPNIYKYWVCIGGGVYKYYYHVSDLEVKTGQ